MGRRYHGRDKGFSRGQISGGSHTAEKLQAIGSHVLEAAKTALANGAEEVVKDAKSRCPVSISQYLPKGATAGALRDSIKAEANKDKTRYFLTAHASVPNVHYNGGEGVFYYGQIVEFSPRINKPYLYPAFDAKRDSVMQGVEDAIRNAIKGG